MSNKNNRPPCCSFCGQNGSEATALISGPSGYYICSDCIQACTNIIESRGSKAKEFSPKDNATHIPYLDIPRPSELKDHLDQYVIGQESVKKSLSVAVHNHYKRLQYIRNNNGVNIDGVEIEKSNVLMVGPTGCGKTLLAKTLAKKLNVPFALTDATTLTEAGYVGEDVENILLRLVQAADYNLAKAQIGIIFVDEIDKIARKTQNVSVTRDVSGEGVQQALLKILEGTIANIPPKGGRKHPEQEYLKLDTSNILFICAGAFVGLDKIIHHRTGKKTVGFVKNTDNINNETVSDDAILDLAEPEDLLQFGLIPEFIGRLPILTILKKLTRDDMVYVLTNTKNSLIKQYQELFKIEGIELIFTHEALEQLADLAISRGTGARGLRAIMEKLMLNLMYDIPSLVNVKSCTITKEFVLGTEEYKIKLNSKSEKKTKSKE